ncbi:MAG TPA: hypothetical protein VMX38_04855 [Verrucomicrobiae bacterium]|jgi:hypothetical protein|nr:hypothetical protein [Verrucomicrobiae bacterium]
MRGRGCTCLLVLSLSMAASTLATAQAAHQGSDLPVSPPELRDFSPPPVLPHRPVGPGGTFGLMELSKAAGAIFSGRVTAVVHHPATSAQPIETVTVTFHVENAIRGATPGDNFTISQWIGLWAAGQRYRVGERMLVFFYPPSKLGLSSCVGGALGRFSIDSYDNVLLTAEHLSAFQRDTALGGKSRVRFRDFASAVRQAIGEE